MNNEPPPTRLSIQRDRSAAAFPIVLACVICGKADAGRGKTPNSAKSSLGLHRSRYHPGSPSLRARTKKYRPSYSEETDRTGRFLAALGPFLDKYGGFGK